MRLRGRGLVFRRTRGVLLSTVSVAASLWLAASAQAADVDIRGQLGKGFGRIELKFERTTKINVRTSNGVVVIGFAEPTRIKSERLTAELPAYVSAARRDPDDTGLRLAIVAPVRANVIEAGERVFVDLLPANWQGLPPGLPPEVVAELAERARIAEAKVRATERPAARQAVPVRVAEVPSLTRLVFEPPPGVPFRFRTTGRIIEAEFDGLLTVDLAGSRPKGTGGVADFKATESDTSLVVKIAAADGYEPSGFVEAGTLVVDLAHPSLLAPEAAPALPHPPVVAPAPPTGPTAGATAKADDPPAAASTEPSEPAAPPSSRRGPPRAPSTLRASFRSDGQGSGSILFPFEGSTPAAAFARGDRLTIVFDTVDPIDPGALGEAVSPVGRLVSLRQGADLAVIEILRTDERPTRLVADRGGWRLAIGEARELPPDESHVARTTGESGQPQVLATLPTAAAVHWLDDTGSGPIAVVTATGRPRALGAARRFVEFTLAPTLQGLVVEARADDVSVGLGRGGVLISSRSGLSLSSVSPSGEAPLKKALVLDRETWGTEQVGTEMLRYHQLLTAASEAPKPGRAEARHKLARFLAAHGMSAEASTVLAVARSEDAAFARRREPLILAAAAAVRSRRPKDARAFLDSEALVDDPEAAVWRAAMEAQAGNNSKAVKGFRTATAILDQYPEDVAGELGLHALRAALAIGDVAAAELALTGLDRLSPGSVARDIHDLMRARVDEAAGRTEAAATAYERLAEQGGRPVQAEAVMRGVTLAGRTNALKPELAMSRLELLAVSWRGDAVELGALVELSRLYAAAGRWRDVFLTARRADTFFPMEEATRRLHDETAQRFEALVLGQEDAALAPIDVLSLYYDFKELAPIGRRGDEIVRRLADRLVELDLLDQAAALLQHQVDKRLTGTARAAVATRLAAIRLIGGKPREALLAIESTRLAELPASLRRFRLLIEAQTQAELGRVDLALEIAGGEEGEDFARLRAGLLFGASRWREAGEAYERLAGLAWRREGAMSDAERSDVVRAAVADVMADERIALDRLRAKFGTRMADSPDAQAFEVLLRPGAMRTPEFRTVLRNTGKGRTLRQLLADWSSSPLETEAGREGRPVPPRQG